MTSFKLSCCFVLLAVLAGIKVESFNFQIEDSKKQFLIIPKSEMKCATYNELNKKDRTLSLTSGAEFCAEDPFCRFFLFNSEEQIIRLCYDKSVVIRQPPFSESWITAIKEEVFENFAPSLVNTQGLCSHETDILYFDNFKDAIKKRQELNENFMISNLQSNPNGKGIEVYFCKSIEHFVNRNGYVITDFTKMDKPRQSCLKAKKCRIRGVVQPDNERAEEGIYKGDIVEVKKI